MKVLGLASVLLFEFAIFMTAAAATGSPSDDGFPSGAPLFVWIAVNREACPADGRDVTTAPDQGMDLRVTMENVVRRLSSHVPPVLVDVRPASAFGEVWIPGSQNLPLFAVKTKPFLKEKDVVLVDRGYGSSPLLEEAAKLREMGFRSLAVLEGGIPAWQKAGGALEGSTVSLKRLRTISPESVVGEKGNQDWLFVGRGVSADQLTQALWPGASVVAGADEGELVPRVRAALEERQELGFASLVLVTREGTGSEALASRLDQEVRGDGLPRFNTFVLDGGLDAYRGFVKGRERQLAGGSLQVVPTSPRALGSTCGSCR